MLNLPVHLHPSAMIDCGHVMLQTGLLDLHGPIEILWFELSRSTTSIDLSLRSSWLDPHVGTSCVLDSLEMIQLVLINLSQDPMQKI